MTPNTSENLVVDLTAEGGKRPFRTKPGKRSALERRFCPARKVRTGVGVQVNEDTFTRALVRGSAKAWRAKQVAEKELRDSQRRIKLTRRAFHAGPQDMTF